MAQFRAGLADQFDAEWIFALGRFDNVVRRDDGPFLHLVREDRRFAVVDAFDQFAVDGTARDLGLDTSLFAAMAQNVVVLHVNVAEFT